MAPLLLPVVSHGARYEHFLEDFFALFIPRFKLKDLEQKVVFLAIKVAEAKLGTAIITLEQLNLEQDYTNNPSLVFISGTLDAI